MCSVLNFIIVRRLTNKIGMTILQEKKSDKKFKMFVIALVAAISTGAIVEVFLYNQIVNLRHDVSKAKAAVQNAEITNAELKTNLYESTDQSRMQSIIDSGALVLEKNPEYLKKQLASSR